MAQHSISIEGCEPYTYASIKLTLSPSPNNTPDTSQLALVHDHSVALAWLYQYFHSTNDREIVYKAVRSLHSCTIAAPVKNLNRERDEYVAYELGGAAKSLKDLASGYGKLFLQGAKKNPKLSPLYIKCLRNVIEAVLILQTKARTIKAILKLENVYVIYPEMIEMYIRDGNFLEGDGFQSAQKKGKPRAKDVQGLQATKVVGGKFSVKEKGGSSKFIDRKGKGKAEEQGVQSNPIVVGQDSEQEETYSTYDPSDYTGRKCSAYATLGKFLPRDSRENKDRNREDWEAVKNLINELNIVLEIGEIPFILTSFINTLDSVIENGSNKQPAEVKDILLSHPLFWSPNRCKIFISKVGDLLTSDWSASLARFVPYGDPLEGENWVNNIDAVADLKYLKTEHDWITENKRQKEREIARLQNRGPVTELHEAEWMKAFHFMRNSIAHFYRNQAQLKFIIDKKHLARVFMERLPRLICKLAASVARFEAVYELKCQKCIHGNWPKHI